MHLFTHYSWSTSFVTGKILDNDKLKIIHLLINIDYLQSIWLYATCWEYKDHWDTVTAWCIVKNSINTCWIDQCLKELHSLLGERCKDFSNYKQIGKGHPGEGPRKGGLVRLKTSPYGHWCLWETWTELNQPNERNEEEARASWQHNWPVQRLGGGEDWKSERLRLRTDSK